MNKEKQFETEIKLIKNEKYKEDLKFLINKIPDYFFEVPAASTGKYHPKYAQGNGGLLRHTKAAVRIGYELLNNPIIGDKYTSEEKDLMLISLMLHDGLKSGLEHSQYTKVDHPVLMSNYIESLKDELKFTDDERLFICKAIKSHMGPWNTDYDNNEIMPKPVTKYENFVHMCDYLASRKCILLEFDTNNNIIG